MDLVGEVFLPYLPSFMSKTIGFPLLWSPDNKIFVTLTKKKMDMALGTLTLTPQSGCGVGREWLGGECHPQPRV